MEKVINFILLFLTQFAGGPGPIENNLVRFGLPAILWGILLYIAGTRQSKHDHPREKLLVWGFALAFIRESYMLGQIAYRILDDRAEATCGVIQPLEHGLSMIAMILVSGAFISALSDKALTKRYLQIGIGVTILVVAVTSWTWPRYLAANPGIKFHQSYEAWFFHLPVALFMAAALCLIWRTPGWLRNVVGSAFACYLISELLLLINYATGQAYNAMICPVGNSLHILAAPLLGYVYFKEQAMEKRQAEKALIKYQDHLKDLVEERTNEIGQSNKSLSTQNAVAVILSQSLHIETNLKKVLEIVRTAVEMEIGWIFLADADHQSLNLYVSSEILSGDDCACQKISRQAFKGKQVVSAHRADFVGGLINRYAGQTSINRLVSVPLVSKGVAVGAMTLGRSGEADLQLYQFELLTSIGFQIGMAVENARLYQESETRAEDITRLDEASSHLSLSIEINNVTDEIARQSAWLLRCPKSCVVNVNFGPDRFMVHGSFGLDPEEFQFIQHQLPGWTFLKSFLELPETVAISDAAADGVLPARLHEMMNIRSFIILPVWASEQPHDFIVILDDQSSHRWQPREIELIERLAIRAAVALMNANLHQQRELAAALEERHRIAANMHDGLAQTLSLLNMKVDRLQEVVEPTSGEVVAVMDEVHGVVAEALVEVRRSVASLQKTHAPRASLQKLIQGLVESIENPDGPQLYTELEIAEPVYLAEDETAQVLPLVQEAILNAIRHADPRTVRVRMERAGMKLQMIIEDDGCGFDPNRLDPVDDHFGLSIMRARAERLHGVFTIESSKGEGTRVTLAWIPGQHKIKLPGIQPSKSLEPAWGGTNDVSHTSAVSG